MRQNDRRRRLFKTFTACLLAVAMLLTNVMGAVEVWAEGTIPAPTIDDVFYGATTISGKKLHRDRVNNQTVRATVHVKLTGTNGEKAKVSVTPTSGSTWTVSLPEGVEVAAGDKVTVYQELNGIKSSEVTANAKPSKAYENKDKLKMPTGEIWIEKTNANIVNDDEQAEAIEMLKKANRDIAKVFKSVKFSIDGTNHAYYEVTYTDKSTSGKIEATDLKIKQVTETSAAPTIEKVQVTDRQIIVTLEKEVAAGTKFYFIKQFSDGEDKTFCQNGNCTPDKTKPQEMSQAVSVDGKKVTFPVKDDDLELKRTFGIIVKEPHKFRSCAKSEPVVTTPAKVAVRDPHKLTDDDKKAIDKAIRDANTVDGVSKLPDGTGSNVGGAPAIIEISDDGEVKIISPNDVDVNDWDNEGNPIYPKNPDGTVVVESERVKNVITIPAKDLVKNLAPKVPSVAYDKTKGEITVTPDKADTDAKTITVKYKDPEGSEKTETATKDKNGKWSVPEGSKITVNPDTGVVTIKDSDIQSKTKVSATVTDKGGIADDDKGPKTSDPGSKPIKIYPKKPKITVNEDGSVTITPIDKDNDRVAKKMDITYTPVGKDETKTVTVERKDDGTWTVPDGSDFKVSDGGKSITIANEKIKSETNITAKTNDGDATEKLESEVATEKVPDKTAPQPPTVEVNTTDGTAHITPPTDPDTTTIEVKYPGADGKEKTFTATKKGPNTWEITGNNGESIDVQTGKITIPYEKLKKADTITARAKDKDGNESKSSTDTTLPPVPTVTPNETSGDVTVTPPTTVAPAVDGMEITYTPAGSEETKTLKVVKGNDSNWKIDGEAPENVTIDAGSGLVTFKAGTAKANTNVIARSKIGEDKKGLETAEGKVPNITPPDAPEVKVQEDGSVKITPKNKGETTVTVTYKDQDGQDKTATATKGKNGKWSVDGTNGEEINEDSGVITIPTGKTNPGDDIKATAKKGSKTSGPGQDFTKPAPPTVTPDKKTGNVTITPPTKGKVDGMVITYKDPENKDKTVKVKKGDDGTWTFEGDAPEGVAVNGSTGVVTIPKGKAKEKTEVVANSTKGDKLAPAEKTPENQNLVPDKTAPNTPTVALDNATDNMTITPPADEDTTSVTVTYKKADNTEIKVRAKKAGNKWSLTKEDGNPVDNGESVNETSGVITIPKGKYKLGEAVSAYGNDNVNNQSGEHQQTPVEVSFDMDGGKQTIDSSILVQGGSFVLPAIYDAQYFPLGKEFDGWMVGSARKKAGDSITINANTEVKAIWKP